MRFKNLTITITLGCLSIVALAGLVMLPISGNCELHQHGWYYNTKNIAANITVTEDTKGDSWQVDAFVSAKEVSASITPDDHNLSLFTEDKIYSGTGYVSAVRLSYNFRHSHLTPGYFRPDYPSDQYYTHTHTVSGAIDINHKGSSYYNGGDDALTLDIQANAKVEKHTILARKKGTNKEITVTLGVDTAEIAANTEFTVGQTTYVSTSKSDRVYVYLPVVAQRVGVEVGVPFDESAVSIAQAEFDFAQREFRAGLVRYTPP